MADPYLHAFYTRLLHGLKQRHGVDFASYQSPSVIRRITYRMEQIGIKDWESYSDHLLQTPEEYDNLFATLLINHTSFFRNPPVWGALARLVPQLLARKRTPGPLRVWSAGCSSGQEPYTLAMLLAEQLGLDDLASQALIYATDIDSQALQELERAQYSSWALRSVPPILLEHYFKPDQSGYIVRDELRRAVVAWSHNLIADPPLQRIDLLACRNLLIYFKPQAQAHAATCLRRALSPEGALLLGVADMALPEHYGLRWVDRPNRIAASMPDRLPMASSAWRYSLLT